jgi:hypothetical protein
MSDLSNLYISQSYKGLINLADSTKGITGQTDYELQDGLGQGVGVSILSGSVLVENEISSSTVNGIGNVTQYSASVDLRLDELEATASDHDPRVDALEEYTSSLRDAFTVSGSNTTFKGDINISGSITAYELFVTTESASVIFSSGSNILGDEPSDVQIFSGSVYVPNLHYLAGNPIDTNLRINQKLDTGSFLTFSASVESQLEQIVADALPSSWTGSVFLPFSASVDTRLDDLENFSSSLVLDFVTQAELEATASTLQNNIDKKLDSASFDAFSSSYDIDSASFDVRIDTKLDSASFNNWTSSEYIPFSSSIVERVDTLASFTGSYATTGSNLFFGSQSIDGDVTISGSFVTSGSAEITGSLNVSGSSRYVGRLQGNVVQLEKSGTNSDTASIQTNEGHFYVLDLNGITGSVCRVEAPGSVDEGLTWTLKVKQPPTDYVTLEFATESFEFPRLTQPITTPINGAIDIFTFVSFDNQAYYGIITKDLTPQIT